MSFDFIEHLQRQRDWSSNTFGPGPRVAGVLDHIRKECNEVAAKPDDLSEWIDIVILALDGAWRSGATPQQIVDALAAKQAKNEARVWPDWRTMSPDKAIEHDRSKDERRIKIGDRVRVTRRVGTDSSHASSPPLGWEGIVDIDDKSPLPLRVTGDPWEGFRLLPSWWFTREALELLE